MTSAPGDGEAVPLPTTTPLPLAGSQEGEKLSSYSIRRARREFILKFSTIPTLLDCGTTYIKKKRDWNRCESPLCRQCAPQRANALAAELRALSTGYASLITVTLSISTTPSTPLRDGWDSLDAIRDAFTKGRWLTSRMDGFAWFSEITRPPSWHPHVNFLLVSRIRMTTHDLTNLRNEIKSRWSAIAARHGVTADPNHQTVEPITRTPGKAIWYLVKGPLLGRADSPHLGHVLDRAAVRHDAEAAADWLEFEEASTGRRWRNRGGELRKTKTIALRVLDDHDDLMALLDVEITIARRPRAHRPSTGPQVAAEHRQPTAMAERAEVVRERLDQHERDRLIAKAYAAEQAREQAEHDDCLARFARHREALRNDDPGLWELLDGDDVAG